MKLWLAVLLSLAVAELPRLDLSRASVKAKHGDDAILVATADGVCHRLDSSSGAVLWSSGIPGGALLSSFQAPGEERLDQGNSGGRRGLSTTMIPAVGGTVLSHSDDGGLQAVGLSVSEMVTQTPKLAGDGNLYLGSKASKLFGFRLTDGADLSIDSTIGGDDDESAPAVFFSRTDYTMRALNSRTRSELWNFTYSDVVPLADLTDRAPKVHGDGGTNSERSDSRATSPSMRMVAVSAPADGTLVPLCATSRHPDDEDEDDANFNDEVDEAPCNDFVWEPGFAVPVVAAFVVQPPACSDRNGGTCGEEDTRVGTRSEQAENTALLPLSIGSSNSRSSSDNEGLNRPFLGAALKQLPVRHTIFEPRHQGVSAATAGAAGTSASVFQMDDGDWSDDTDSAAAAPSLYGVLYESSPSQLALGKLSHEEAAFVSRSTGRSSTDSTDSSTGSSSSKHHAGYGSGDRSSGDAVAGRSPKHANPRLPRLPAKQKGAAAYRKALAINDDGSTSSSLSDQEHELDWDELSRDELNERVSRADAATAVATARAVRAKWGNYSAQGVAAAAAAALAVSGRTQQRRSSASGHDYASTAVVVGTEGTSSRHPRQVLIQDEDNEIALALATTHKTRSASSTHRAFSQTLAASKRHAAALAALIVADDAGCASDSPAFPNCLVGLHVLETTDDSSNGLDSGIGNSIDSSSTRRGTQGGSTSSTSKSRDSNSDSSTVTSRWYLWLQLSMAVCIVVVGFTFGGRSRVLRVLLGLPDPLPPLPPPPTSATKPGDGSDASNGAEVAISAQDHTVVVRDGDGDIGKEGQKVIINSAGNVVAGQLEVSREVLGYGSMGTMVFRGMLGNSGNDGMSSDKDPSSSSQSGMKRGRPVAVKRLLQEYHHHAAREIRLLIESDGHPNVVRYFVQEAAGGFVYLALELCSMTLQDAIQRICRHQAPTRASVSAANAHGATDAEPLLNSASLGSNAPTADSAIGAHLNAFANNTLAGVDKSWASLPPKDRAAALGALREICDGVAYLHKQRIVHRDLKPMNILLAPRVGFAAAAAAAASSSQKAAHVSVDDKLDQEPIDDPVSVALAASRNELKTLVDLRFFTLKISDMGLGKLLSPGQSSLGRSLGAVAAPTNEKSRKTLHLTPPSSCGFGPPSTEAAAAGGMSPNSETTKAGGGGGEGNSAGAAVGTTGWQAPEVLALRHQLWEDASGSSSSSNHNDIRYHGGGVDDFNDASNSTTAQSSRLPPHAISSSSNSSSSSGGRSSGSSTAAAGDLWSCGCVFFYVLTRGSHLFGDKWFEREANVVQGRAVGISKLEGAPEALDLVQKLTAMSPLQRSSAEAAQQHPFFWPPLKKLTFLVDLSDRLEQEPVGLSVVLAALESDADLVVGRRGWHLRLDPLLLGDATKWRKYDVCSIRDLLRVLRNKRHHWNELPLEVRSNIERAAVASPTDTAPIGTSHHGSSGSSSNGSGSGSGSGSGDSLGSAGDYIGAAFPEALLVYFERAFPLLLMHCFRVACACLRDDPTFAATYVGEFADYSQSRASETLQLPRNATVAGGPTSGLPLSSAPRVISDRRLNAAAGEWKPASFSSDRLNASVQEPAVPALSVPSLTSVSVPNTGAEEAAGSSCGLDTEDTLGGSSRAVALEEQDEATRTTDNTPESNKAQDATTSELTASEENDAIVSKTSAETPCASEATASGKKVEDTSVSTPSGKEAPTADMAVSDEKLADTSVSTTSEKVPASQMTTSEEEAALIASASKTASSESTISEGAVTAAVVSSDQVVSTAATEQEPGVDLESFAEVPSTESNLSEAPVEAIEAPVVPLALPPDAVPTTALIAPLPAPPGSSLAPTNTGALPAPAPVPAPPPPSTPEDFGHLTGVLVWAHTDAAAAIGCRGWVRGSDHWRSAASSWGGSALRGSSTFAGNPSSREPLSALPGPLARAAEDFKFRTRLCQHWDSTRGTFCPIRRKGKCDFAHGPVELRVKPARRNKWPHPCDHAASSPASSSGAAVGRGASDLVATTGGTGGGGGARVGGGGGATTSTSATRGATLGGAGPSVGSDLRAHLRLSGGEDVYGGARHVERLRRDDGKDEVEKQRRSGRGQPARQSGRDHHNRS